MMGTEVSHFKLSMPDQAKWFEECWKFLQSEAGWIRFLIGEEQMMYVSNEGEEFVSKEDVLNHLHRSRILSSGFKTFMENKNSNSSNRLEATLRLKLISYASWNRLLYQTIADLGGWQAVEGSSIRVGNNDFASLRLQTRRKKKTVNGLPLFSSSSSEVYLTDELNSDLDSLTVASSEETVEKVDEFGNHVVELRTSQFRAQYGRTNSHVVQQFIREACVSADDRFLDIGSGIGQVVLQVAATVGCPSVGLELLPKRHETAERFVAKAIERLERSNFTHGAVKLLFGDFTSPEFRKVISRSTVLFVNNACGTFSERCVNAGKLTLNMHLANLCRQTAIGTRVLVFERVKDLDCPELQDVFTCTSFETLQDPSDWTAKSMRLYVYTKVKDCWICPRCTFQNPLANILGHPVTRCLSCCDDPVGMSRHQYPFRNKMATLNSN